MERRSLAWLLLLPLTAAGSLAAHALSYELVHPEARDRAAVGAHDYLEYAPLFLALCLTLVLVALAAQAFAAFRGQPRRSASAWPFALLPPLGFAVQEHLERLIASGSFPWSAALEPTFLVGLLLQLPFALAALVVGRALADFARKVGRALARGSAPAPLYAESPPLRPVAADPPRIPALALGYAERGPPLRLS